MTTKQIENVNVKKALKKEFPNYKISVRQDRGTASGWKQIRIDTDIEIMRGQAERFAAQDKLNEITKRAGEIIRANCELYHFSSDDGYDTQYECLHIETRGIYK